MTIGISTWVDMEQGESQFQDETPAVGVRVLSRRERFGDARPVTRGPFVVITSDGDGGETSHYFTTVLSAQTFAAVSDDEVVSVEGPVASVGAVF